MHRINSLKIGAISQLKDDGSYYRDIMVKNDKTEYMLTLFSDDKKGLEIIKVVKD